MYLVSPSFRRSISSTHQDSRISQLMWTSRSCARAHLLWCVLSQFIRHARARTRTFENAITAFPVHYCAFTLRARQPGVTALGPVRQSDFLFSMGMAERLQSLIEHPDTSDEQVRSRAKDARAWTARAFLCRFSADSHARTSPFCEPPCPSLKRTTSPPLPRSQAQSLYSACERLVDPAQMGEKYKVLGLVDSQQRPPLAGFA